MRLIQQVEVAYFRSFYKDQIQDCADTNVIFGRNDAGKSNLLRALNLFFNNQTSPGNAFVFERDLNHSRRAVAEGAAGIKKFVYVKIWFKTPANWRASLGEEFWVKKQWSVTTESDPHLEWSAPQGAQAAQRQYLTRFLNKVRFHYVPAIKDRRIFESLQAEIYNVVSQDAAFRHSLDDFANGLRDRTLALSEGLLDTLKTTSAIAPPQDLTDLFRSLDFETTSEAGDAYSLTLQRGDGIQVRHIPPILAFLSDRSSKDFHIWGFEEPENSLELATAIEEAETFRGFGRQNNKQIFLTSHSPAFFSLEGDDVTRHFVSRSRETEGRLNSSIEKISPGALPSELMGETPHLPVISHYLREAHEKLTQSKLDQKEIAEELRNHNQTALFVEGESDRIVIAKAWEIITDTPLPFTIVSANGTTKMKGLAAEGSVFKQLLPNRKIFALVDNDREGRDLKVEKRLEGGGKWVQAHTGVHWCRLPFSTELRGLMEDLQVAQAFWPGTLENLVPIATRQRAMGENSYALLTTPYDELCAKQQLTSVMPYAAVRDDGKHLLILSPSGDCKIAFAEWLVRQAEADAGVMEPLRSTILGLQASLA